MKDALGAGNRPTDAVAVAEVTVHGFRGEPLQQVQSAGGADEDADLVAGIG
jgi:hypothetical protein